MLDGKRLKTFIPVSILPAAQRVKQVPAPSNKLATLAYIHCVNTIPDVMSTKFIHFYLFISIFLILYLHLQSL